MKPEHPIRLVIADVDGKLLTKDKVLTERAARAVRTLKEEGVRFALTSGRPPRGLAMLVTPLGIDTPTAAFNGGMYVNPDLSPIETLTLDPSVVVSVARSMEHHGLDVWLYRGVEWLIRRPDAPHVAREQRTVQFPPTVVPTFSGLFDGVVKVVGIGDDSDALARGLADVHEQFPGEVSAARSQPYYVDVTHPDANKGRVVRRVSQLLGIPLEQVAAIGDMPNDVPMFRAAALGIAMGHASDDVKRYASHVTTSSEDEGFALAMEKYILGERSRT
jgi:Cof subfamily protein (haloacid dehalogenase superfamily)